MIIPAAVSFLAGLLVGLSAGRTKRRVAEVRALDAENALAESLRVNVELAQKFNSASALGMKEQKREKDDENIFISCHCNHGS